MTLFSGPYALLARFAALAIAIGGIYLFGYIKGHHSAELDFAKFKAEVATLGEAQERRTAEIIKANNARKEKSDAIYRTRIAGLTADIGKLRNSASTSFVPPAPSGSRCPEEWACYDRNAFDNALRTFAGETAEIAGRGEAIRLQLTTAIESVN